jgi:DcmR-like sensory protein/MerR-like DNA binding protein
MSTKVARRAPGRLADYLRVGEAAAVLGVSPWTLRNWDNCGKLEALRHPQSRYRLYWRDDLEALLRHEGLRGRLYERSAPRWDWTDLEGARHFVQFYERDAVLVADVTRFVGDALRAGEGAVVIATPAHRQAIQRKLGARGLDVAAARRRGQLVCLDAGRTLAGFIVRGSPDRKRFREVVGGVIARAAAGRSRVRAFGEMVALLWAGGRPGAAVRLERLWNELAASHTFVLHCAYPMPAFNARRHGQAFGRICDSHARVIPAESYAGLSTERQRLRAIARLQQKAQALETEVARRKRIERALRGSGRPLPDRLKQALAGLE